VRRIARLHGGDARVVESSGGGSCFRVELPVGYAGSDDGNNSARDSARPGGSRETAPSS
jgi:hypothetical protein